MFQEKELVMMLSGACRFIYNSICKGRGLDFLI